MQMDPGAVEGAAGDFSYGERESGDIVRGFENGADDYISKPFDLAVLHARVRAC